MEVMPLVRDAGEQIVVFSATDHGVYCGGQSAVRDPGEQIVVFSATDYGIYCGGHSACA